VFKRALHVATVFGVLVASYAAYVRAFAIVARSLSPRRSAHVYTTGRSVESPTSKQATDLAIKAFGREHWSAAENLQIRIYDADRGVWMYARDYRRLGEGKQIEFRPFAIIWLSRDGKSMKTGTSESALIDLDRPFGLVVKPGEDEALKVVHAKMEGDVRLRDDKGTPEVADDLRIGPLTYVEYDDPTLLISGDDGDVVVIEDRDLRITGQGLLIKLRPREDGPAGFNGAQTAYLKRNIHIVMSDVGPSGILPGNSQPAQRAGGKTPIDLRCDGMMQVDLPKPHLAPPVGPPAPRGPTIATFHRNVEVLRGKPLQAPPDQLNCDDLRLTLLPADKPASQPPTAEPRPLSSGDDLVLAAVDSQNDAARGGPLSDLTLRRMDASGHTVWLYSPSQGIKARCNELIYKKLLPEAPDETYLRGDATTRLVVEKVDIAQTGPDKGKVSSFTTIRTIDATIFDDGRGNDYSTIVARGPGELESRPGLNKPVARTARWNDQLVVQAVAAPTAQGRAVSPTSNHKKITLTGSPVFTDAPSQFTLDARRTMVVWLKPKPPAPGAKPDAPAKDKDAEEAPKPGLGSESFEIEMLVALGDVNLRSPGKTLYARDRLDAEFEPSPGGEAVVTTTSPSSPPARTARTGNTTGGASATTGPVKRGELEPARPADPAKPADPAARAAANRVWAKVLLKPATPAGASASSDATAPPTRQGDIEKAFLRGAVTFHQDPEAGKTKGTNVVGEAVDVYNHGERGTELLVFNYDPEAEKAKIEAQRKSFPRTPQQVKAESATWTKAVAAARANNPLARVETDEMTVRGEVVGLDQTIDQAWVEGPGSLTQLAARGLLSDKGVNAQNQGQKPARSGAKPTPAAGAESQAKASPMTVTFAKGMRFFGQSTDPLNRPAGRAEFYSSVHAVTDESTIDCSEVMRTYLDRTVKLIRPKRPPASDAAANPSTGETSAAPDDQKAQIAFLECVQDVVVINHKFDPETKAIVQKQRIEGDYLIYNRATGQFRVPGEGMVYLYELEGQNTFSSPGLGGGSSGSGTSNRSGSRNTRSNSNAGSTPRVVRPTSGPGPGQKPTTAPATAVVGRNNSTSPGRALDRGTTKGQPKGKAAAKTQAKQDKPPKLPMILTQIHFHDQMMGRLGSGTGTGTDKTEPRWADFFGDVEALRAGVASVQAELDPDRPPLDAQFITAQTMRVVSEPSLESPDAPPRYFLKAWENAYVATHDKTIQADRVTYDSRDNKFFAYGENGRDVLMAAQQQFGQTGSVSQGTTLMFNAKTGEAQVWEPKTASLIDLKTGSRPRVVPIPEPMKPKNPKRVPFRNLRGDKERRDFHGS
jgi:hypothetical protein